MKQSRKRTRWVNNLCGFWEMSRFRDEAVSCSISFQDTGTLLLRQSRDAQ